MDIPVILMLFLFYNLHIEMSHSCGNIFPLLLVLEVKLFIYCEPVSGMLTVFILKNLLAVPFANLNKQNRNSYNRVLTLLLGAVPFHLL